MVHSEQSFSSASGVDLGEPKKLLSHKGSLAFLTMFNEKKGIVIEHQSQIDPHVDTVLSCTCYRVACNEDDQWSLINLFSFSLPLSLLLPSSKTHLTESIYPLLPRVCGNIIYFVNFFEGQLHSYRYQEGLGVIESSFDKEACSSFTDLFPPYLVKDSVGESSLVYGGCLQGYDVRLKKEVNHNDDEVNNLQLNNLQLNNSSQKYNFWSEDSSLKNDTQEAAEYLFLQKHSKK